jgi:hypothetical protein
MSMTLKLEHRDWPQGSVGWESADGKRGGVVHSKDQVPEDDAVTFFAPAEDRREWIADVAQVTILGVVEPHEMEATTTTAADGTETTSQTWESRWPWLENRIELHAWMGADYAVTRTLLCATFTTERESRWMLVERAWLLSEAGATIERIAP